MKQYGYLNVFVVARKSGEVIYFKDFGFCESDAAEMGWQLYARYENDPDVTVSVSGVSNKKDFYLKNPDLKEHNGCNVLPVR